MGARSASLERQHEIAKNRLTRLESELTDAGVAAAAMRRHARWRNLRADCRTIARRLNRAREIENFEHAAVDSPAGDDGN